jgi:hypothetical protein
MSREIFVLKVFLVVVCALFGLQILGEILQHCVKNLLYTVRVFGVAIPDADVCGGEAYREGETTYVVDEG